MNEQMTSFQESLAAVLTQPTPTALWRLRGDLLQAGLSADHAVWDVIDRFYDFLNALSAGMKAHEFNKMATMLDIGAVGGVAVQGMIEGKIPVTDLWKKLVAGSVGEGLMVLASRQYIKSAHAEIIGVYNAAAWDLFAALWDVSAQMQPNLSPADRRGLLDHLLAPVLHEETDDGVKMVLIGRLFQMLLLVHLIAYYHQPVM